MHIVDVVISFLSNALNASATLAVVAEFALRFAKTEKPRSIAWLISEGAKKVAEALAKFAELLDKVFGQRVKA